VVRSALGPTAVPARSSERASWAARRSTSWKAASGSCVSLATAPKPAAKLSLTSIHACLCFDCVVVRVCLCVAVAVAVVGVGKGASLPCTRMG
jgi:hypothetical protein